LLDAAGESPPYILVGHSFGGYNMRLFADRYLDEVAGIVLVDSSHEDQAKLEAVMSDHPAADWNAFLTQLRTCHRLAIAGTIAATAHTRSTCAGQFFRGLPERTFSAPLNTLLLGQALAPKQYAASLGEAESFPTLSADEVRRARRSYGATPLRILTATNHFGVGPHTPPAFAARAGRFERGWQALQRSWLALSTNARLTLAARSGHYVQLDRPELVIAAIREEIGLAHRHIARNRGSEGAAAVAR
jgi:pimeloyl-ACP methyl ester carboxylesterase